MSEKNSYVQILKSSSIMGGVALFTMLLGFIKTKFSAILIGVVGVGLTANYVAIQTVFCQIAGLGIQSSAVRNIASAIRENNDQSLGRAVLTLHRICWLTGLLGMILVIGLSPLISQWTFGSKQYVPDVAALSLIVLLANLTGGYSALLQGTRRIRHMALANASSAMLGVIITVGFYFLMGLRGIIPALVLAAAMQFIIFWRIARTIQVEMVVMTWNESFYVAGGMIRLGIAMMWSGFLGSIVIYAVNALITQQIGLEAVGIFSAAFAVSGILVNFILNAMGADYYPRLTGFADDREGMNKLVNEQAEIGLLLAMPGLIAVLSLAPWIIHLLYTSDFLQAARLLQWFILGCMARVIQWPMGFIQLALNKVWWFTFVQTLFNCVTVIFVWWGITLGGIEGVSVAYFLQAIFSLVVIVMVARHITDFHLSDSVMRMIWTMLPIVFLSFVGSRMLPIIFSTILGLILILLVTVYSLRGLAQRVGSENRIFKMLNWVPGIHTISGIQRDE